MYQRLFGTDGIRGAAGAFPLDPRTIGRIGAALVLAMGGPAKPRRLIIGRDTRESGAWIERELARGIRSQGGTVLAAGVIPTPAVAFLTRADGYDAGVVISASHNPYEDNGIKIFSGRGEKFSAILEAEIERIVGDPSWELPASPLDAVPYQDCSGTYVAHLKKLLPGPERLEGQRILLDCANGATTWIAPRVLEELGLRPAVIHGNPDGRNINLNAGSTHLQPLIDRVKEADYWLGVAFDGDGDRALFVGPDGRVLDGDHVLFAAAKHLKSQRRLKNHLVVATVMSNVGLEVALRGIDVDLVRCPVGDRFVAQEMASRGASLGGEQSGHIIFWEHLFTGDGIGTMLSVLRAVADLDADLPDLVSELEVYPQMLVNVPVRQKTELRGVPAVQQAIAEVERELGGRGRVLVRYSGTEPLLRVMLEGPDRAQLESQAERIVAAVKANLGAA